MFGLARIMLGFKDSLIDGLAFCHARNALPFSRSRSLRLTIQDQKLCLRSLGSKISMLKMFEIDVFAARSKLYFILLPNSVTVPIPVFNHVPFTVHIPYIFAFMFLYLFSLRNYYCSCSYFCP